MFRSPSRRATAAALLTALFAATPAFASAPTVITSAANGITATQANFNGTITPNGESTTGWFRRDTTNPGTCDDTFGVRVPSTGGTGVGAGNAPINFSVLGTGLNPGTTYYYCAIAQNPSGTVFGGILSFTTPPLAPATSTTSATSVTSTSASLDGASIPNGASTTGWFRYSLSSPGSCNDSFGTRTPATGGTALGSGANSVPYSQLISGLLSGATYYFCAISQNSVGTTYGNLLQFTTLVAQPAVVTNPAYNIYGTQASLDGNANPNGAATTGWYRISSTNPGGCNDAFGTRVPASGGTNLGGGSYAVGYQQTATGLNPGTTYYFCAIAQNSVGTGYGTVQTFTTPAAPTVTTSAATSVASTSAILNGSGAGNGALATGWFRYSTTNPGVCDDTFGTRIPSFSGGTSLSSNATAVSYSYSISSLLPGTTYYFCAIASNSVGTSFGTLLTFNTPPATPIVSTLSPTAITSTGATLNGQGNPRGDATTGYFRYATTNPGTCNDTFGTRAPASNGTGLGSGNTTASFAEVLTGLTPGTTYYYCALATNSVGTGLGGVTSFTTPQAPTVTTQAASSIGGTYAYLNGFANPNGALSSGWFRYDTVDPGTCNDTFGTRTPATGGINLGSSFSNTSYSQYVSTFTPGTTYYFCALASNAVGTSVGAVMSFTTPNYPTATTSAATLVTATSASLNGSGAGNGAAATAWFRYSTTSPGTCNNSFGTSTASQNVGSTATPSTYTQPISGLVPGTTYYFCAIANNMVGYDYGAVLSFTTPATAPIVSSISVTNLTGSAATLNGTVNARGDATVAYFRYSTTQPSGNVCNDTFGIRAPVGTGGTSIPASNGNNNYLENLTGLSPGTTYYWCAIATNSVGTGFGSVFSFTTPNAPTMTTVSATVGGNGTTATITGNGNGNGGATTGWFRYDTVNPGTCNDTFGTRAPTSGGTSLGSSGTFSYSQSLTGLTPGATYFYCAIGSNLVGTSYGSVLQFTLPNYPTVVTNAATGVTTSAATLNGAATPNGAASTGWFRYATTSPGTCNDTFGTRAPSSGGTTLGSGNVAVPFSVNPTVLNPGTTYYYCAIAQNSVGTSFGAVLTFTTASTPPTVTSLAASSVTGTSATLNGTVNPNGDATTAWFRYSTTSPGATCNDTFGTKTPATGTSLGAGSTAVAITQPLTGLTAGATYYFCAIAQNSLGTAFGAVLTFSTPAAPQANTGVASPVTATTATLNASAIPGGTTATGWFRYSATDPGTCDDVFGTRVPATGGTNLGTGGTAVNYSYAISGLLPGTSYYYCAIAQNSVGTSLGAVFSFTTPATIPTVITQSPTSVTASTAVLNASANPNGASTNGWFRIATVNPGSCNDTFGVRVPATSGSPLGTGTSSVPYSLTASGLSAGTTYYYCAIASNAVGVGFGALTVFTTPSAPTMTTSSATGVNVTTATLTGTVNPNGDATNAFFRYDTVNPGTCNNTFGTATAQSAIPSGTTTVTYSQAISGLTAGTTYYFCAIGTNSVGTSFGLVNSFTTPNVPLVVTSAPSVIGNTTATLSGSANPNGLTATGWFRYSTTSPGTCNDTFGTRAPASGGTALGAGTTATPYTQAIAGLVADTTYYVCAIASNSAGTGFGAVLSFKTIALPVVTTGAASSIGSTTVTLAGTADPKGSATSGFFRYSTVSPGTCNTTFGTATASTSLGSGQGAAAYTQTVTGLATGTTYYYCAEASNSVGTGVGTVQSFTTLAAPTVSISAATSVTDTTATLNGVANPRGDATTAWFRYATVNPGTCNDTFGTRAPASGGASVGSGSTLVSYSQPVTGLTPGTTYFVCAIAQNSVGTSFSTVGSFVTPTVPTVNTNAASTVTSSSALLGGNANPNNSATTGWFRYSSTNPGTCDDTFGTRLPATGGTSLGSGATTTTWTQSASGLTPATTYYFCAIAQNAIGTSFGSVLSFTTASAPTVTTVAASSVTGSAATLNGTANPNGLPTTGWFRYATTNPGSCNDTFGTRTPASGGTSLGAGSSATPYAQAISALSSGTTYYYCAIASNSVATSFGAVMTFVTPGAPSVTTDAVSAITGTTATLNGTANPNLGATTSWFRYSTVNPGACNDTFGTRTPASGGTSLGAGSTPQTYSQPLTGLAYGTMYFVCAIAQNSVGTSWGNVQSFTTLQAPATTTVAASSVTDTAASLNGTANPNGAATTGWFRYATVNPGTCNDTFGTRAPVSGGTSLGSGTTAAPFTEPLTGLTPGATYYFCAIAQSAIGTTFGNVLTFTTPTAPTVTTNAPSSVLANSATFNGSANPNSGATTGWFRYDTTNPGSCNDTFGTRAPASGGSSLGSGTSAISYTQAVTGLTPSTTYYVCAIASNVAGTSVGTVQTFTTPAAPNVTTLAATGVTGTTATINGSANPNGATATGWFRYSSTNPGTCNDTYGTRTPASGGTALGAGNTAVSYNASLTGLANGTTYYVCAIASNSAGTSFGTVVPFTTPGAPIAATQAASGITSTGVTLNGSANPNNASTTGWFRYATTSPGTCNDTFGTRTPASGGSSLGSGTTQTPYSQAVTGLSPNTTYFFCAIAQNSLGTSVGTVTSFTTPAAPTVTTSAATAVTSSGATLNGSGNPNGDATTAWFRYDTTNPGTCNDTFGTRAPASGGTSLSSGTSAVPYSLSVSGLSSGTTYYVCALASNAYGTSVGSVVNFTTPGAPTVTTSAPTLVTANTATLNGGASPNGGAATGWFRYATTNPGSCNDTFGTRAPASGGTSLGSGFTSTAYSQAIAGLTQGTTYYVCAIASNSVGTSFGSVLTFTTQDAPAVTTAAATSVTATGATLNGAANPNGLAATGWFRYSTTNPGACDDTFGTRAPASGGTSLGSGSTAQAYTQALSGLTPGATYYYCAIASNSVGTAFGTVQTFNTGALAPVVTTSAATNVGGTSATLNASANPNGGAATGWFRYATTNPGSCNDTFGTRAPTSGGTSLGSGNSSTPFSEPITGLTPGTTYYFCALASNGAGTSVGALLTISTPAAPTVFTFAATAVTSTSATFNGAANPNGSAATGYFRYATVNPGTCNDTFGTRAPTSGGSGLGSGSASINYSQSVNGLTGGTTYYFCAIAQNTVGTSFGSVMTVTTTGAPTVTTQAPTAITSTSAALNGSASPNGLSATGWFRYATTSPGTCNDTFGTRAPATGGTALGSGTSPTAYTQNVSGLSAGTTYFVCAIASNSGGTSFGAVQSFTTNAAAPTVTTSAATLLTGNSATLNGAANPGGAAATGWFRYSTTNPGSCNDTFGTRSPATGGSALGSGSTSTPYAQAITGLSGGTTYYFCALASNSTGTGMGQVLTFQTPAAPTVATASPSNVTGTTAILNGSANANGSATTGWFRYAAVDPGTCDDTFGTRAPASGGTNVGSGTSATPYSQPVNGLTPGTTYFVCAIASNAVGTSFGPVLKFTAPSAPTVMTSSASNVTSGAAILNGAANPNGAATAGWFRYDTVNPGSCNDSFGVRTSPTSDTPLGSGTAPQGYSSALSDILPGTTYYFCAIAQNSEGLGFGEVLSFTSEAKAPAVTTKDVSDVDAQNATLNGEALPNLSDSTGWFRYATTKPAACDDTFGTRVPASGGIALGKGPMAAPYSVAVTALAPNTKYYFCAVASNAGGAGFGQVLQFTTTAAAPGARTLQAVPNPDGTVTLNGAANPNGVRSTGWFQYTNTDPGAGATCKDGFGAIAPDTAIELGDGTIEKPFSQVLFVKPGTYYYCATVKNVAGTSYGEVVSFEVADTKAGGCGCGSTGTSSELPFILLIAFVGFGWRLRRRQS